MQAGVHAHLYSISTTTSHRGLAQWRSRGNDVLEALAEVDAPAVEGGELLDRVRVRVRLGPGPGLGLGLG